MTYHSQQPGRPGQRLTNLELLLSVVVLTAVIIALVLFLFVFHDAPLRVA